MNFWLNWESETVLYRRWFVIHQWPLRHVRIGAYHHQKYEFESCSWRGVLDTTLCDKVCQCLATSRWFSPGTPVSSTSKTDRHDITEILLKVAINTVTHNPLMLFWIHTAKYMNYLYLLILCHFSKNSPSSSCFLTTRQGKSLRKSVSEDDRLLRNSRVGQYACILWSR
jgi:hypothetical protein